MIPTTRSRAATVPQARSYPAYPSPLRPTPHPLYIPRTTRVYPQPHVVEMAREKIGSSQQQQQPQSPPSPSLYSSDSVNSTLRPKEGTTRRRLFRLWKDSVTVGVAEPAAEQQPQVDDVWVAWEKEQRRAHEMTIAAALDNKPRFAFVEPTTEPISRVSSNNSSDESPAETDHRDHDCHGVSAFFRSLFNRRLRPSQHVRRTPSARAALA